MASRIPLFCRRVCATAPGWGERARGVRYSVARSPHPGTLTPPGHTHPTRARSHHPGTLTPRASRSTTPSTLTPRASRSTTPSTLTPRASRSTTPSTLTPRASRSTTPEHATPRLSTTVPYYRHSDTPTHHPGAVAHTPWHEQPTRADSPHLGTLTPPGHSHTTGGRSATPGNTTLRNAPDCPPPCPTTATATHPHTTPAL